MPTIIGPNQYIDPYSAREDRSIGFDGEGCEVFEIWLQGSNYVWDYVDSYKVCPDPVLLPPVSIGPGDDDTEPPPMPGGDTPGAPPQDFSNDGGGGGGGGDTPPPITPPPATLPPPVILPPITTTATRRRVQQTGEWEAVGDWWPDPATVAIGQYFEQSRQISRRLTDQIIDVGTGEVIEDNSTDEFSSQSRQEIGTHFWPVPPPGTPAPPPPAAPPPPPLVILPPITTTATRRRVQQTGDWMPISEWAPDPSEVMEGESFTQSQQIARHLTDQIIDADTGEVLEDNSTDEFSEQSVEAIGTRPWPAPPPPPAAPPPPAPVILPPVTTTATRRRVQETGDWMPISEWSPDPSEVMEGDSFTQSQQIARRLTDQIIDADTGEVLEDNSTDDISNQTRGAIGTRPWPSQPPAPNQPPPVILPPVEVRDTWRHVYDESAWEPTADWAPDPETIPQGQSFTQTRPLTRTVQDYWEDSETGDRREDKSHPEFSSEAREAAGTLAVLPPFEVRSTWVHRYTTTDWEPITDWAPDPATVPASQTFTQSRRTSRQVIDFWEDTDTGDRRDDISHPEFSSEARQAQGELIVLPPFVVNEPPAQPPPPVAVVPPPIIFPEIPPPILPPPPIIFPPPVVTPPPPQNKPPAEKPPTPNTPPPGVPKIPMAAAAGGNSLWLLLLIAALAAAADKKKSRR